MLGSIGSLGRVAGVRASHLRSLFLPSLRACTSVFVWCTAEYKYIVADMRDNRPRRTSRSGAPRSPARTSRDGHGLGGVGSRHSLRCRSRGRRPPRAPRPCHCPGSPAPRRRRVARRIPILYGSTPRRDARDHKRARKLQNKKMHNNKFQNSITSRRRRSRCRPPMLRRADCDSHSASRRVR